MRRSRWLVGPPSPEALATVLGAHSLTSDFVDHYRMAGADFDYALEERWVRDESLMKLVPKAVAALLSAAGVSAEAVKRFLIPHELEHRKAHRASLRTRLGGLRVAGARGMRRCRCGHGAAHARVRLRLGRTR